MRVSVCYRPTRPPTHGVHSSARTYWGLTEAIWELMEDCWAHNPSERPVVKDIISRLSSVDRVDARPARVDMSPSLFRIQNFVSGEHSPFLDDVGPILFQFA
jgi:serine/threonine-protein kinase TNNI3K